MLIEIALLRKASKKYQNCVLSNQLMDFGGRGGVWGWECICWYNRLNMELDLPNFIWAPCALYSLAETPQYSAPPAFGFIRALLVSQDRRHLFLTPWLIWSKGLLIDVLYILYHGITVSLHKLTTQYKWKVQIRHSRSCKLVPFCH
jgi:hypothetical protein